MGPGSNMSMGKAADDLRLTRGRVARHYAGLLKRADREEGCPTCAPPWAAAGLAGYGGEDLLRLPRGAAATSLGCGNPVSFCRLEPGDAVLDLGAGAGLDLILAAVRAGPTGMAVGIDMAEGMLVTARERAAAAGLRNVYVAEGFLEELPVASSSFDWVVSNCAVNLSPRKEEVFAEAARVLKPGGRLMIADIVVVDLPVWVRENESLYGGCIGGAAGEDQYRAFLQAAGLTGVVTKELLRYDEKQLRDFLLLQMTGSAAGDPCSCSDYLLGRLIGRAAEILAGTVRSVLFAAAKPP